jgi:hypothetical protein
MGDQTIPRSLITEEDTERTSTYRARLELAIYVFASLTPRDYRMGLIRISGAKVD